jgi:hypothetical protein
VKTSLGNNLQNTWQTQFDKYTPTTASITYQCMKQSIPTKKGIRRTSRPKDSVFGWLRVLNLLIGWRPWEFDREVEGELTSQIPAESAVRTTLLVRTAYDPSVRRRMAWSFSICTAPECIERTRSIVVRGSYTKRRTHSSALHACTQNQLI